MASEKIKGTALKKRNTYKAKIEIEGSELSDTENRVPSWCLFPSICNFYKRDKTEETDRVQRYTCAICNSQRV